MTKRLVVYMILQVAIWGPSRITPGLPQDHPRTSSIDLNGFKQDFFKPEHMWTPFSKLTNLPKKKKKLPENVLHK